MKQVLRVGHKDYNFEICDLYHLGLTDHVKSYIHIDKRLSPTEMVATILHEVSHALAWVFTVHNSDSITEERWCDVTGNGLTMVFRDNPWLMKLISSKLIGK